MTDSQAIALKVQSIYTEWESLEAKFEELHNVAIGFAARYATLWQRKSDSTVKLFVVAGLPSRPKLIDFGEIEVGCEVTGVGFWVPLKPKGSDGNSVIACYSQSENPDDLEQLFNAFLENDESEESDSPFVLGVHLDSENTERFEDRMEL